MTDCLA